MDIVVVNDLRFKTIIGVWDWERQLPQFVSLDLEMGWDMSAAVESGELEDALNYKAVSKRAEAYIQEQQFELVETAAHKLAKMIMTEFSVPWIRVSLRKPFAGKGSKSVGVIVELGTRG
jgi:dihydroneopterin aldolase